jgi:uncharacterized delta-60 repeat protein
MRGKNLLAVMGLMLLGETVPAQSLTLDPAFGTGGKLLDQTGGFIEALAVLVQPDGKILVGGTDLPGLTFHVARYLPTGVPDPVFLLPPIPSMQGFFVMALQADGKIVAVGPTGGDFGIVRLLPGGSPDPAFDGDGHDSVDFSGGFDRATAVAIQPDGKIVVAGFAETAPNTMSIAFVRYLTNGMLDPSFGTGGKAVGPVQSWAGTGRRVLIDSLGRILAAGYVPSAGVTAVTRFTSGGLVDEGFGSGGSIELPYPFTLRSISLTADDGVLIVGRKGHFSPIDLDLMQMFRFTSAGLPDVTFGEGGEVLLGASLFEPEARAAVILGDGRFYVAGLWSRDYFLGRFLEDGSLDPSFGVGGFLLTNFVAPFGEFPDQEPRDIAMASDGDVVIAGRARANFGYKLAVARFDSCPLPSINPPTIIDLSIDEVSALGGFFTTFEISGTGFDPGTTVRFGDSSPTGSEFVDPTLLYVRVDPHPIGDVDVVVRNSDCQSATLPDGLFYYPDDVPPGSPYYAFVRKLIRNQVTAGCMETYFCGWLPVTRAQMAVFLLRSKEGASYVPPPATGTVFDDVPIDGFAAAWIEELAARGITAGCDVNLYCPDASNTRAQMAVFLLVTLEGTGYMPPDPTGVFVDVPVSSPYARWIEELFARGITGGCAQGMYCPDDPVLREQMAVFLSVTFSLPG